MPPVVFWRSGVWEQPEQQDQYLPPKHPEVDCKQAHSNKLIYDRVPYPGEILFFVPFSQIRFLSANTQISVSSKIPLKEIGHLQACFRCESR